MHLIEVRFKGNRKEFFHWTDDEQPALGAPIIVDADRGEDLGVVHSTGELAGRRFAGAAHGELAGPVTRQALRLATAEEYESEHQLRHQDDEAARRQSMERVKAHGLTMKVTDAEWQWDRKKLTLYFTAERRVDFRALVRDLASAFRARIELKQIGVRDEARRLDGIGRCGRQYCSASWLPELRPVNLGVAKDQGLSLNPLQISGACGRLMCCLRYEHEFYVQSRKRFPKEGRILVTARGEEKVVSNDIFNDRVTLRNVEGDVRVAELAELRAEIAAWSDAAAAGADSAGSAASDGTDVEPAVAGDVGTTPASTPAQRSDAGQTDADHGTSPGDEPRGRGDRAPRPRRALPMGDATPRPRSSRPSGRARPTADAADTDAADTDAADTRAADTAGTDIVRAGLRPAPPRSHTADATDADATDAGETDAGETDAGETDADETRRRRRSGRRGGRRGRGRRGDGNETDAEQATDPGAASPAGSDDQGE